MRRFLLNWWTLSLLTAVLAVICLTLALPIFIHALRPWWVRLLLLLVVTTFWGAFAFVRVYRARSAAEAIAKEIARPMPGEADVQTVAKRMSDALALLRKSSGGRRDYLYSRPWYMIIGPPGSGKTTALLNSGLRFPYSDTALKGVGGTRNLDFWFADEAVLVDTAGRYTTQDSDRPADERAWRGFLGLLRKQRPLQPINGVIVAISVDELLRADRVALDAHAAAVRLRLMELRQTLETSAPVYVVFTKADLLAGFVEFYDDLDVEGRRAVVGATLPLDAGMDARTLAAEFDALAQSVADRGAKRLQDEPDARRRSLILGFPAQVETLRARALRLLEGIFVAGVEPVGLLRGFYLCSGLQEGAPLDRLLGSLAAVYDQPHRPTGQGRAYFLNRLLTEVIFPESGLLQEDPVAAARRRTALMGGLAAIGAVAILVLVLWAVSFVGNRSLQDRLLAGAQNGQSETRAVGVDLVEVKGSDPDLEQSLSILRALRNLPGGYAERRKGGPPLLTTFGLYQRGHADEAEQAYKEALQRILLPRILLRLEAFLRDHRAEPLANYEALKAYLILGGQGPFNAQVVKGWVQNDWATAIYPGSDREGLRKELESHLDALLEDGQPNAVWPDHHPPLDADLIASARQTVQGLSLADRAYAILRQRAVAEGSPWRASGVLASGDGRAFAGGDAVLGLSVPYVFTAVGYQKSYARSLATIQADLRADSWVMGTDAATESMQSQMRDIGPGVAVDYARDYIAAWQAVVKAIRPADYFHDPAAFGTFTRSPSPLKILLLEVRKNTTLSGAPQTGLAGQVMSGVAAAMGAAQGGVDAGQQISREFKSLSDYVGDGKSGAPIDDFIAGVKTAGVANTGAAYAGGGLGGAALQGQLATAIGGLAAASAGAPPILQDFVTAAVQGGKSAQTTSAQGAVADAYRKDLAPICHSAIEGRYPFNGLSQSDAAITEMLQTFGPGGAFDNFSRDHLSSLLNRVGPIWRWNTDDPVGALLDPLSAEQFHKAAEIRDLLAAGLPIQVEGAGFGGSVTAVEVSNAGVTYRFEANSAGARPLMWSVSGGVQEAHVTLYAGTRELKTYSAQGPWALFRIMDKSLQENSGPTSFKATFGEGTAFASLKFNLNSDRNPFRRGSLWSFRCPSSL